MPASSYTDYVRIMKALPGTANDMAPKCGLTPRSLKTLLWRFEALGLVNAAEGCILPGASSWTPIWAEGEADRAPQVRKQTRSRPCANHIAFASIWRGFQEGTTMPALAADSGVSQVSCYRVRKELKGSVRITAWEKDSFGRPVAVWTIGTGQNLKKPSVRSGSEKWKARKERSQWRLIQGLAA